MGAGWEESLGRTPASNKNRMVQLSPSDAANDFNEFPARILGIGCCHYFLIAQPNHASTHYPPRDEE